MREFRRELKKEEYTNATINRSIASLRRMFTQAQEEGRIQNLPYFPMLPESKPRHGTLAQEKYPELLSALPGYLRPVTAIGYHARMRLGEILGLRWENIIWKDRIIRIEDSKNGEAREIPFAGELEVILREEHAGRQAGCDRVCYRIDQRGHARPIGDFRKVSRRVCVKLGLATWQPKTDAAGNPLFEPRRYEHSLPKPQMRYDGLIFHDLRRSFITDAEHAGAPRHEVMNVSGHKTESVYKRYAIENRERRRAALDTIDEYRAQKLGHNSGTISASPKPEIEVPTLEESAVH
jgi:integrase